jgi:solute carrier family 9 (sodium/hydrogen exchanger), member 6/7
MRGKVFSVSNVFNGLLLFAGSFLGSIAIGMSFALLCALLLKHTQIYRFHSLESCIILLIAYASYVFSNAVELSGIVSLLFWYLNLTTVA